RDILARLGLDFRSERLFLRIHRTGERKILPDHHAQLVADVVEVIRLINPAAPDAQHVRAGIDGLLNALPHPRRIAGTIEKAVVGNPVEAFAEDWLAVDFHDELRADGVGGGVEFDGAEANSDPFRIIASVNLQSVQWLRAVPQWPP